MIYNGSVLMLAIRYDGREAQHTALGYIELLFD